MTIRNLIEAAQAEDASKFETAFKEVVNENLTEALSHQRAELVAEMFGLEVSTVNEECDDDMEYKKKDKDDEKEENEDD